jgi:hypothetical protein
MRIPSRRADAHALEQQSIALLGRPSTIAGDPTFVEVYERHLEESRERDAVERRLNVHDSSPSTVKDAAMRLGGLNWSAFFQAGGAEPLGTAPPASVSCSASRTPRARSYP